MSVTANVVFCLAMIGAAGSWIAGAIFYVRTLRAIRAEKGGSGSVWLAVVAWPFAAGRLREAAAEHGNKVNKAIAIFLTCVLVAAVSASLAANLQRVGR